MATKLNLQIMLNCVVYTLNFDSLVPPNEQEQFKVKNGIGLYGYNIQMIAWKTFWCKGKIISKKPQLWFPRAALWAGAVQGTFGFHRQILFLNWWQQSLTYKLC
jgi:hypothetical protein